MTRLQCRKKEVEVEVNDTLVFMFDPNPEYGGSFEISSYTNEYILAELSKWVNNEYQDEVLNLCNNSSSEVVRIINDFRNEIAGS